MKYGIILLVLIFFTFTSCFNFRTSNRSTLKKLKKVGLEGSFTKKTFKGLKINYLKTGTDSQNCVVFIHGAPGANDAFANYMKDSVLLKRASLVAVDRPGYGYSDRKKSYYSMQEQSNSLSALLRDLKSNYKHLILVGHSYGGSLVAKLAMENNDLIDATVQISGAVDPENEKMFWFAKLANSPFVFWSLSKTMKVTTREKMMHAADLKTALTAWSSITKSYTVIHGDEDKLVPYSNLEYTKKQLTQTKPKIISIKNAGHLLIWDEYVLIRNEILLLLK